MDVEWGKEKYTLGYQITIMIIHQTNIHFLSSFHVGVGFGGVGDTGMFF